MLPARRLLPLLLILAPPVLAGSYVEDFTSPDRVDLGYSTAHLDTVGGTLGLAPYVPGPVGWYDTLGPALDVLQTGHLIFVAAQAGGVQVLDVSDPAAPQLAGSNYLAGTARGLALAGGYLFLAHDAAGLRVLDVQGASAPVTLTLAGTLDTPGIARDVAVAGPIAVVADGTSGIRVVDITDPAAPTEIGFLDTPGEAWGVALDGTLAFVADLQEGLRIVDLGDPTSPVEVGSLGVGGYAQDVAVDGDRVYVASGSAGLLIVDVENPAAPALLGIHDTPGDAQGVSTLGTRIFVADGSEGLLIVDVTDPTAPVPVYSYDSPGVAQAVTGDPTHVVLADGLDGVRVVEYGYVGVPGGAGVVQPSFSGTWMADHWGDRLGVIDYRGLTLMDISDPENAVWWGTKQMEPGWGRPWGIILRRDFAVVWGSAGSGSSYVATYDVSSPAPPGLLGTVKVLGTLLSQAAGLDGTLLRLGFKESLGSSSGSGIHLVDLSDPTNPEKVATLPPVFSSGYTGGMAFSGKLMYVTEGSASPPPDNLKIFDITDPLAPVEISSLGISPPVLEITVEGTLLVGAGRGDLAVVDVSDPTAPANLGWVDVGGARWNARSLTVSGRYAFVDIGSGAAMVDLSDPTSPSVIQVVQGDDMAALEVVGRRLFLFNDYYQNSTLVIDPVRDDAVGGDGLYARSLPVDDTDDTIVRCRIEADYEDDILWVVSANGGAQYQTVVPGFSWSKMAFPGTDVVWHAIFYWTGEPGPAPVVRELTVNWLLEYAPIVSLVEVPGGLVDLAFQRSGYEFANETVPVTHYEVYRRVDGAPLLGGAEEFPPGTWQLEETLPAVRLDEYEVTIPRGDPGTAAVFFVAARTDDPGIWYASPPDSVGEGAVTGVGDVSGVARFALGAVMPNPVRSGARIPYSLGAEGSVRLEVFDVTGRRVRLVESGVRSAGEHEVSWDGLDERGVRVPAGVYLYRLVAGEREATRRLVVLR